MTTAECGTCTLGYDIIRRSVSQCAYLRMLDDTWWNYLILLLLDALLRGLDGGHWST